MNHSKTTLLALTPARHRPVSIVPDSVILDGVPSAHRGITTLFATGELARRPEAVAGLGLPPQ
jgi:hypothetical protein